MDHSILDEGRRRTAIAEYSRKHGVHWGWLLLGAIVCLGGGLIGVISILVSLFH